MKPSEMRAEIERLTKLTQRQRATINRLQDELAAAYRRPNLILPLSPNGMARALSLAPIAGEQLG